MFICLTKFDQTCGDCCVGVGDGLFISKNSTKLAGIIVWVWEMACLFLKKKPTFQGTSGGGRALMIIISYCIAISTDQAEILLIDWSQPD